MEIHEQRRDAERILRVLENGGGSVEDAALSARMLDPVFIFVIVRFLRESYPATDPAASPVLSRVVSFSTASPELKSAYKAGEADPVSSWFESEHGYRTFRGRGNELIAAIADKLDS